MSRPDFSRRATTPELMDDAAWDFETFQGCLTDLARVNRLTLAYRPTLAFLDGLAREGRLPRQRPLHILDAGSGHGDTLRRIAHWAARRRIPVRLTGIDLNPWSARAARAATPPHLPIAWETGDVLAHRPAQEVDVVISSLFAHHLEDAALLRFLRWMEDTARLGWFINDLHRHPLPHRAFTHASRLMRMHRFVQHDGPVSIARGFVASDWRRLLAAAGVPEDAASIRWWVPFRLCVARLR
ncbi:methyltransferase domain-containing protein [Roseomonas marmotae]|uniref:Methyltransferase domain-containing protein n=1 Tax=Roseomonas marmotae TaxID=2768161 RepID=A0ABS3K770_9PROT|nr:methyltransferase domain-containing protein [Roseomonas marmotae]MBO1073315.1 methyltransferase domain-containing protein [Roseomonas marmotae]QTI79068.1 methyltransferase domain-containing protein [Roseomonas marmotae]